MSSKVYLIILFLFFALIGYSQQSSTATEQKQFVEIYMDLKNKKTRNTTIDSSLFSKYDVTPQRYRTLAKSALNNKPINLNPKEEKLIDELEKLNKELEKENERSIQEMCTEKGISLELYLSILQEYKTNIAFQRSLKPYFMDYIKGRK